MKMPVIPKIPKVESSSVSKRCEKCGRSLPLSQFSYAHSEFYTDGRLPWCNECISERIDADDGNWEIVDKLCMWAGIPFIVKEWERIREMTLPIETWPTYTKIFKSEDYFSLGWGDYYRQYKKLKEVGLIEEELPEVREQRYRELRRKWGENYDNDELNHLEDLYRGLLNTQNINGALQIDQAQKLCKISLEIDNRIRAGDKEVDKFMSSYDKIIKSAEFTPKNTKNATDFDSFAEVAYWLEKHGRINKFYDEVTRDVLDETLKNIEAYNQRLYINEGGIGEEITERLRMLQSSNENEHEGFYNVQPNFNEDEYSNEVYILDDEAEFDPSGDI